MRDDVADGSHYFAARAAMRLHGNELRADAVE